jgi:heme exporter protein D
VRKAFPLLLAGGVVGSLAFPALAGATTTLSSLIGSGIPAGFVATATGTGKSDQPTTTEPRAQSGQVPITPELYLQDPGKAGAPPALPTIWRLWWNPTSQQALTVSLAQYSDTSMATKSISRLNTALTGSVGNSGLTLTSVFVPVGLPGAHGYNLSAATSATPSKSPFTVSAVLFRNGTVEYLDTILAAGTEPATGAVSSFALAQYHDVTARPAVRPHTVVHHRSTWPWIAGGAVLVLLIVAFIARRRAVVRRRRRRRHRHTRTRGAPQGPTGPTPRGTAGLPVSR